MITEAIVKGPQRQRITMRSLELGSTACTGQVVRMEIELHP